MKDSFGSLQIETRNQKAATPENIRKLGPNDVFVFGSNYAGNHGKGAALTAKRKFGAVEGIGTGLSGRSYGIATKDHNLRILPLYKISIQVQQFRRFVDAHPNLTFYVTKIGCGLSHYKPRDIKSLFDLAAPWPDNAILPIEFQ